MLEGVRDATRRAGAPLQALWNDERAPTAVEYGIMLAGVAAAIFAGVMQFGQSLAQLFDGVAARWP